MQILNIAGYKFIPLSDLESLQNFFLYHCHAGSLKGTILLSYEGINISLAGKEDDIQSFIMVLTQDSRFQDMQFHESYSEHQPFQHLKVKLKNEIITLRQPEVDVTEKRAPAISPKDFKQWLDENKDITILDTRNDYEVRFGTFKNAVNLNIADFSELPISIDQLDRDKTIVMFCTGGIRCEKAALYMLNQGFSNVHQLDGGILGYFKNVGGDHYDGECFVFDERVSVDTQLNHTGTVQCRVCQGPVSKNEQEHPTYVFNVSCPSCIEKRSGTNVCTAS